MLSSADSFFRYGILGNSVRLDASTVCQLKCVLCPQSKGEMEFIGRGYLSFEHFKKFVDTHRSIRNIELANYGEIFLNPQIEAIIRYAREKGVTLTAWSGVNLNTVSEAVLEALVRYRFQGMTVSIDGASRETYALYRRGGDFNRVLENIDRLNYYKHLYQSDLPFLSWQFVIFGHNEHELTSARRMAEERKMGFIARTNWDVSYSPLRDSGRASRETGMPTPSREGHENARRRLSSFSCAQVWSSPQINWDGRLLGCCVNLGAAFGNVFDAGLGRCIRSRRYRHLKKAILGYTAETGDIPCVRCQYFSLIRGLPPCKRSEILGVECRRDIPLPILEGFAFLSKLWEHARKIASRARR